MYMAQKAKKKSKLRHAEYYDMQKTFDSLYADSKSGEVFGHLMDIISAPNNIKLAFRNIKGNDEERCFAKKLIRESDIW